MGYRWDRDDHDHGSDNDRDYSGTGIYTPFTRYLSAESRAHITTAINAINRVSNDKDKDKDNTYTTDTDTYTDRCGRDPDIMSSASAAMVMYVMKIGLICSGFTGYCIILLL